MEKLPIKLPSKPQFKVISMNKEPVPPLKPNLISTPKLQIDLDAIKKSITTKGANITKVKIADLQKPYMIKGKKYMLVEVKKKVAEASNLIVSTPLIQSAILPKANTAEKKILKTYSKINKVVTLDPVCYFKKEDKDCQTQSIEQLEIGVQTDPSVFDLDLVNYLTNQDDVKSSTAIRKESPQKKEPIDEAEQSQRVEFFNDLRNAMNFDSNGNMPLHNSVIENDVIRVKHWCLVLRVRRESVDKFNQNALTPLQLSLIHACNPEIVRVLLAYGANPTMCDDEGNSIIHLAVENNRKSALHIVLEQVKYNISQLNGLNYEGQTPLMLASVYNFVDCAKMLLEYEVDPDITDSKSGRTALFYATENEYEDLVELLLKHNANTKICNFFGVNPYNIVFDLQLSENIKRMIISKDAPKRKSERPPRVLKVVSKRKKINNMTFTKTFKTEVTD